MQLALMVKSNQAEQEQEQEQEHEQEHEQEQGEGGGRRRRGGGGEGGIVNHNSVSVDLGERQFSIHPNQLETINRIFTPSQIEIDYAKRVVNEWETAIAQGKGSLSIDNRMIDVPVVKRAKALLDIVVQTEQKNTSSLTNAKLL